jgi:hypothetical protein
MSLKTKHRLFAAVLIVTVVAGIRLLLIYRSRQQPWNIPQTPKVRLHADDYVVPRKLYAYDLVSLRQLVGQPVWIRGGYQLTYYPCNPAGKHADLNHESGLMGPIERVEVKDVIEQPSPENLQWEKVHGSNVRIHVRSHEVLAVFEKDGKNYAFPIGQKNEGEYRIFADDLLYYQDPRQLYQHWPPDVWNAVERHEAQPGMNELQVLFAIGVGALESYDSSERVLRYPNGGKPLRVTFIDGKAQKIEPVS